MAAYLEDRSRESCKSAFVHQQMRDKNVFAHTRALPRMVFDSDCLYVSRYN